MPVSIRIATREDAALIADMSRQTFYESFAGQNSRANMDKFMNEQFTRENLMAEVGASGNIFLLAYYHDEPVGYARMRENNQPPELQGAKTLEIARIYAVADYVGKGVGKLLMKKCLEIAGELKKDTVWLGVWEYNQRAIAFYRKWGFEKFSTHVFMLGDDAQNDWLMAKKL
ncbi:MAG TPA: GNAT family N-acetyltransferase [Chitinophagaceae bacterium]|nr:GNAT family N-acetyltransferase [Chitinophagaceae bacterium]